VGTFDPLEGLAHISLNSVQIEAGDGAFFVSIHTQLLSKEIGGK
jgi:hypothetical protein